MARRKYGLSFAEQPASPVEIAPLDISGLHGGLTDMFAYLHELETFLLMELDHTRERGLDCFPRCPRKYGSPECGVCVITKLRARRRMF